MIPEVKYIDEQQAGVMPFNVLRIETKDLFEYVAIALKEDDDLLTKYSFLYSTMDELLRANVDNTVKLAETKEVKCYGIFLEDTPIGYTVISEKLLYSFGINIYCRQPEIKEAWFKWLRKVFNSNFVVCLYRENTRAINFFLRNGLEEFNDDGKVVYLLFNK